MPYKQGTILNIAHGDSVELKTKSVPIGPAISSEHSIANLLDPAQSPLCHTLHLYITYSKLDECPKTEVRLDVIVFSQCSDRRLSHQNQWCAR